MIEIRVEAVILTASNKILIVLHRKKGKSYWVLPGGHLERGEKLSDCIERELKEELSVESVEVRELVFVDEHIDDESGRHVVKIGFLVLIPEDAVKSVKVKAVDEAIVDARLFGMDDIIGSEDQFYPSKEFLLEILDYKCLE